MALHLIAPAKLNLTLEVLGKRDDGYHEIASVMQTIDLSDRIIIEPSDSIELEMGGSEADALPADSEANLAYRAAIALREASGRASLGARIALHKKIPPGAGLGGGSSDAAAVLRGLNSLWHLRLGIRALTQVAATLGSDVPFFLHGGTALATGRGEQIEPLLDVGRIDLALLIPPLEPDAKTARMYAALDGTDYSDGVRTRRMATEIRRERAFSVAHLYNAFNRVVIEASPAAGRALRLLHEAGIPAIACGSGPAIFALGTPDTLRPALDTDDVATLRLILCRSLTREAALAVTEV